jgi:hypothetical protein
MGNGDDEASTRTDAGPVPVAVVRPLRRRPTGRIRRSA